MPRHDYQCLACERIFERLTKWDEREVSCDCGGTANRVYQMPAHVIDDALPGGARWMHNLGDSPEWVETKTQFRQELARRGLVQEERKTYCKDDKSPWATATRLRPGQRDPFLHRADFNR